MRVAGLLLIVTCGLLERFSETSKEIIISPKLDFEGEATRFEIVGAVLSKVTLSVEDLALLFSRSSCA